MGAAARERANRQFTLPRMVGAYDALYRTALARSLSRETQAAASIGIGRTSESSQKEGALQ